MTYLAMCLILLLTAAILLHSQRHILSLPLRAGLLILAVSAMLIYSNFGKLQSYPKQHDPAYIAATGNQIKNSLMHWHEIYHYYIGAKYYKELDYDGLYETILLADREVAAKRPELPRIQNPRMRDLSNPTHSISADEALNRANTRYRPRFTDERWEEFKADWTTLKELSAQNWPELGMFDAGFNPPPSWNVIGYTVANLIPISNGWLDWAVTWDEVEVLPLLDVAFLLIGSAFILHSFGWAAFCAFWVIFGLNFLAAGSWIAGSFLRIQWFVALTIGICMLKREKWFWAGFCLSYATCMRIFPAVFVIGAAIYLLARWMQERRTWPDIRQFITGGLVVALPLGLASLLMFGLEYWKIFFSNISDHKDLFFVWHIGYKRIAVFDNWVPYQNFWWAEGLDRFRDWNARLQESWNAQTWYQWPMIALTLTATAIAASRSKPAESCLLFGTVALFMLAIPANYYYIYLALVPVVLWDAGSRLRDQIVLVAFFALILLIQMIPNFGGDDLTKNYRICVALFNFLLLWLLVRLYGARFDTQRSAKAISSAPVPATEDERII